MLKQFELSQIPVLEDWYLNIPPAEITVHNLKTGKQIREPSLVAITCKWEKAPQRELYNGETRSVTQRVPDRFVAAGRPALEYKNAPDTVVFSPFRQGQIVHFHAAQLLIRSLLKQAGLEFSLRKPVMCVHIQEFTTQVEEQALAEAAIQAGAGRVFLYADPLSTMLDSARRMKELQNAVIFHIEPQNEKR